MEPAAAAVPDVLPPKRRRVETVRDRSPSLSDMFELDSVVPDDDFDLALSGEHSDDFHITELEKVDPNGLGLPHFDKEVHVFESNSLNDLNYDDEDDDVFGALGCEEDIVDIIESDEFFENQAIVRSLQQVPQSHLAQSSESQESVASSSSSRGSSPARPLNSCSDDSDQVVPGYIEE